MLEEVEGTTDPATLEPEKRQLSKKDDAISFVELPTPEAKFLISSATTANPLP